MWVSTAAFVLVYTLLIPVGLYARNIMPGGLPDTDLVVPRLLIAPEVFSAGTGAFLLLAMVAAAMSSLDSVLLVMASTQQRDLAGMVREPVSERRFPWTGGIHQVFPGMALSFLAYWLVARCTPSYESGEVDRLFEAERSGTAK